MNWPPRDDVILPFTIRMRWAPPWGAGLPGPHSPGPHVAFCSAPKALMLPSAPLLIPTFWSLLIHLLECSFGVRNWSPLVFTRRLCFPSGNPAQADAAALHSPGGPWVCGLGSRDKDRKRLDLLKRWYSPRATPTQGTSKPKRQRPSGPSHFNFPSALHVPTQRSRCQKG